jgi:hypothetical protein
VRDAVLLIGKMLPKITFNDEDVFIDCCWALNYNFPNCPNEYQQIINKEFVTAITSKLSSKDFQIHVPVIRLLGHIVKIDSYIDLVLQVSDFLSNITIILDSPKKIVRLEICWMLSNITGSHQTHISQIINNKALVNKVVAMFEDDTADVKK